MAALILVAFLERPWEGLCAPNIVNNVSNSHRLIPKKFGFWLPFGLHFGGFWGPLGLKLGILVAKIRKKEGVEKSQKKCRFLESGESGECRVRLGKAG